MKKTCLNCRKNIDKSTPTPYGPKNFCSDRCYEAFRKKAIGTLIPEQYVGSPDENISGSDTDCFPGEPTKEELEFAADELQYIIRKYHIEESAQIVHASMEKVQCLLEQGADSDALKIMTNQLETDPSFKAHFETYCRAIWTEKHKERNIPTC